MSDWQRLTVVAAVAIIVFFTNLGGPKLWDRDEPRNAGCAREMLARGDWVTPVFNGELRAHKPVLLYWLMMVAYQLLGVGEFAARLPSALAAFGTALAVYAIGRRLFGRGAATWAGVAVATNFSLGVAGRAATPDALILFLSTLAITIYVYGTFAPLRDGTQDSVGGRVPRLRREGCYFPSDWRVVVGMYAVMGLATLAKGPVGIVLPTAVLGMFLLLMRLPAAPPATTWWGRISRLGRPFGPIHFLRTCWVMRPFTAIAVCLVVAAPWYLSVGTRTDGEFLRGFFLDHNVGRAMQTMEGHAGGILFYPASLLVGFFPWSVFALPILVDARRSLLAGSASRTGYLLAGCWVGVYLGAFTVAQTKLPSYITPCFPGAALATGVFLHRWVTAPSADPVPWVRAAFAVLLSVGVLLAIGLPIAAGQLLPGETWLGLIGLVPLCGSAGCWWLMKQEHRRSSLVTLAATATLMVALAFGWVAERVSRHQRNGELLQAIERQGDKVRVASFGLLEPTWVFYGERPVHEISLSGEREWLGGWIEKDRRWQPKSPLGVRDLAASREKWVVIVKDEHSRRLRAELPADYEVLARVPYFLKEDDLVLLGPPVTGRHGESDKVDRAPNLEDARRTAQRRSDSER